MCYYSILLLVIIIVIIVTVLLLKYALPNEYFENLYEGSHTGFGFTKVDNVNVPLFVNFYRKELGQDFELSSYIQRMKITVSPGSTSLKPIFFFPDIGASLILARWKRTSEDYFKDTDAYENFETSNKWKCKDISTDWSKLWFPYEKDPIAQKCWSSIARIDVTDDGTGQNVSGVDTKVADFNTLFDWSNSTGQGPYDVMLKSLFTLGYVPGVNFFVVHYDFRRLTKDLSRLALALSAKMNTLNTSCIFLSHGFGGCVANAFIQQSSTSWVQKNVAAFIPVCPTFGGVPKALKVLLSGDIMQDPKESLLVRDTTMNYDSLYMLLPYSDRYNNLLELDNVTYGKSDIMSIVSRVSSKPLNIQGINVFTEYFGRDPGVPVFILGGSGVPTESFYVYSGSLEDRPINVLKEFLGDGTVPDILQKDTYDKWSQTNSSVTMRLYQNTQHVQILAKHEPIRDLMEYIQSVNQSV